MKTLYPSFYLRIYYFKVKVRLILTLIMVVLGNAEITLTGFQVNYD